MVEAATDNSRIGLNHIRNFSIIAHIDHGKSTLADRFIQTCGALSAREMKDRVLDSMDIEQERGITIKAQTASLTYCAKDNNVYRLNLIDTPGHVDFSSEVARSLAACEGVLLVVDAAQGVEAQSVANCYLASERGLEIIPVLNKIDLPQAEVDRVILEIEEIIGIDASQSCLVSAKNGVGIESLLEKIVTDIPPPQGDIDSPLQALIIDSWFDNYSGVVSLVRLQNGQLKARDKILVHSTSQEYVVTEVGIFTPKAVACDTLYAGDVGYVLAGVKDINGAPVGDTITLVKQKAQPLPGFEPILPRLYAGLFPIDSDDYQSFNEALERLSLNDASLTYQPERSLSLGFGYRCGFLGMLHMDVIRERLQREYSLDIVVTAPNVVYEVVTKKGEDLLVDNPAKLPEPNKIEEIREPLVEVHMLLPEDYLGSVIELCQARRGRQVSMLFLARQVSLKYLIPMAGVIFDFFDRLKSLSRGHASFDYQIVGYKKSDLVKMDILVNGENVDALSVILHRSEARNKGMAVLERMKGTMPRQMYEVALQAAIGGKIIARQTVKALRKDVTAKLYGGDVTRKKKLLEKQKAGKKRMKQIGKVSVPQEAFFAAVKVD